MKKILILIIWLVLFTFVACKTSKSIEKYPITDCETFKKNVPKHWKYNVKEKHYESDEYLLSVFRKGTIVPCINDMDTTEWIRIFGKPTTYDEPIFHYCFCKNCYIKEKPIKELWVTYSGTKLSHVQLIELSWIE